MDHERLFTRYRKLQAYIGWSEKDAHSIAAVRPQLEPSFDDLVDDFYDAIARHDETRRIITGGPAQIERLKQTLHQWLDELLSGNYDEQYVARRWRVGWRHVEIGLNQVYTNAALSRLRAGLVAALESSWQGEPRALRDTVCALHKLLDLDLAIIEDAYQTEFVRRAGTAAAGDAMSVRPATRRSSCPEPPTEGPSPAFSTPEDLERRMVERTAALAEANLALRDEMAERSRAERELMLLKNLALSIGASTSLTEAMRTTLEQICKATGWDCGEVWLLHEDSAGDEVLVPQAGFTDDPSLADFQEASRGMSFRKGKGLPGRVWQRNEPIWQGDLHDPKTFWRAHAAKRAGLTAGMGVPLFSSDRCIAVMAFYVRDGREQDTRLLQLVTAAVAPLGPAIEHKGVEDELARHREDLEQLVAERTEELRETHAQLRHADRLASIGTLAAGLGHDMNNVLLPIRSRLDVLAATELSEKAQYQIAAIRRAIAYLQELSDGLHLLALDPGDEEATGEATNLTQWWNQAGALLAKTIPKRLAFQSDLAGDLPDVQVAPHRLTQAVLNLLVNASESISDEGIVRLWAEHDAAANRLRIAVSDTGEGMTDEVRKHALDPFFTTKKRGLGTGLGLSLVHGVVQAAGGSVEIDSTPGRGTTVVLSLPVVDRDAPPGQTDRPLRAAVSLADERAASFMHSFLEATGFQVAEADDGPRDSFDVWIVDPASVALHTARGFLRNGRNRRVIALGADSEEWATIGASVIEDASDFDAVRSVIGEVTRSLSQGAETRGREDA